MEWISLPMGNKVRDHVPMDGSTFLALWKGQFCLIAYDDEIDNFWMQMLPGQYDTCKLAHEREQKITHYCLLKFPSDY